MALIDADLADRGHRCCRRRDRWPFLGGSRRHPNDPTARLARRHAPRRMCAFVRLLGAERRSTAVRRLHTGMVIDVLLVADTHLDAGARRLIDRIGAELAKADVILHAGDITHPDVLDALGAHASVHAVRGNNDRDLDLPERSVITVDSCVFAMVHDSGPATGRAKRLRRWFPHADVVVFGHSHLAWHETDVATDGHVQHHINPGSAMVRRRAPTCSVAHVVVESGRVLDVHHVAVGRPAP